MLIQKEAAKGSGAGNYRPIACLPLMWKLLTGIFAEKIYKHLESNSLLPVEQKGCRKKSRGTKDQLLIDKAVCKKARLAHRSLAMAWVDYKKAYDMVPHEWILKILGLTKVAGNVGNLLQNSMTSWKTELSCNQDEIGVVDINRGFFQGDSLSPLLFVIAMLPLTFLLQRERYGFILTDDGVRLNHLFFMDDLKLYGKTESELEELLKIVHKFSTDIGMEFGFDKCAMLSIKAGSRIESDGITLPTGETIKDLEEVGYKYLGVLEETKIKCSEMKEIVRHEYLRRFNAVARSKLYSGNMFRAINAWAVSIVRYSAGVIDWT